MRVVRHLSRYSGQAGVEALLIGMVLVALLFGLQWWEGGGVAGAWLQAMRTWYERFGAAIALPV